jgi:diguanylate cyclase (GGDEF)-like protein
VRASDLAARLGGDEFAVFFPETGPVEAPRVVAKLRAAILAETAAAGRPVTVSVGALVCPKAPGSLDELVRLADGLMYRAKALGKDRVRMEVCSTVPPVVLPVDEPEPASDPEPEPALAL